MNKFLANLPSTNFKIFVGECLATLAVIVLLGCVVRGVTTNELLVGEILTFIAAMLGINYTQFAKKRDTYTPAPPNTPDIDDAKKTDPPTGE